ncbi:hypothetical protein IL306_010838 [Fusarium sp. DS 682]|nr:hypothetical protein IL306_010838 [Fusarium sp. DS 682]
MNWFGENSKEASAFEQVERTREHKAPLSHEIIGGAAAFEAAKAYENHVAREGHPDSHAKAKEIIAAVAGAFVDREIEGRGMDFFEKEKAERHARKQAEEQLSKQYGDQW